MNNSQLYKGSLTTVILKLLEENGRMYGYEMTQKVKELTANEVTINEGALYPALHKLEADGLLTVEVVPAGNRMRKYYSITPKGQTETVNRLAELEEFMKHMQLLLHPKVSLG
ncbi:PadR family transcriptional regulator [Arundinibacter roseus]|uniref:PadR family transcriptional regulator n=1 Tax=Arundinibacter roseus TaxID=2070510 RepID=A0A4R4K819_9BACT|nr:PadR family transcriptional regulator [Arundinibacter roseus]TDB63824.1 PadR family transcriptional regulator [Arundinibacter roseus]